MLRRVLNHFVVRSINISRRQFYSVETPKKVCIVGSGPAGFYTAQYIIKVILPHFLTVCNYW